MEGYALYMVDCLKAKIEYHLKASLNPKSQEVLKLVHKQVKSFEELAKTTLNTSLDEAITENVRKLEGIVDDLIDSKFEIKEDLIRDLEGEFGYSILRFKVMAKKFSDGLYNVSFVDEEEDDQHGVVVSSEAVIGVCEVYQQLKDEVMSPSSKVTSLVGMPGVGKTTLANKLFNDPTVLESFDHCVWIRLGKRYRGKDIPRRMLEEMDPDGIQMLPAEHLRVSLKSKKYLIVLDDVWDRFAMDLLYPDKYSENLDDQPFFHKESGSRILITSRLQQLDPYRVARNEMIIMRLLNIEESWDLLRKKMFSQGACPPQLEKDGKKISDNCEGLPLTILVVARLLSQDEEKKSNPEYWDEVATKKNHQIFVDKYDEISKVLLPSYTYLPPLLKVCFMFIGLFPIKYEVPRSKLVNLWLADEFSELNVNISSDDDVFECLGELISNSIVMVYQHSSLNSYHKVKTCGLHSSLWHLSKKKQRRPNLHFS